MADAFFATTTLRGYEWLFPFWKQPLGVLIGMPTGISKGGACMDMEEAVQFCENHECEGCPVLELGDKRSRQEYLSGTPCCVGLVSKGNNKIGMEEIT